MGAVIFGLLLVLCATMFRGREGWSPFALVLFVVAVLAIYVLLTVWADVIRFDQLTP